MNRVLNRRAVEEFPIHPRSARCVDKYRKKFFSIESYRCGTSSPTARIKARALLVRTTPGFMR